MTESEYQQYTILVVDDEEVVVSLVQDALEEEGFTVITSEDPHKAMKISDEQQIDLLITDIRMPNMNGIDMAKSIHQKNPNIAVIFMTGYANLNSAKEAIKQGASDYILKPFELTEIRQAVFKAVEQLQKEAKVTTTTEQLNQLSDFNQMLFEVGDKTSLITSTLKFITGHCRSESGMVLHWKPDYSEFSKITVQQEQADHQILVPEQLAKIVQNTKLADLRKPITVNSIVDHPFHEECSYHDLKENFFPNSYDESTPVILAGIGRAMNLKGLLMIQQPVMYDKNNDNISTFLQITAHQLAMSLENLELLEESQNAYAKLKTLQDETIQLEKMATQGEMSAEIGHELNNFLGVVTGNLSLLEFQVQKKDLTSLSKHISAMADNLEKMKQFTSNLMELRRIATKKEKIHFNRLLSEVIDYLKPQKRYAGVELHYAESEHDIPFEADSMHIQQLLYNLFNNAADATKNREEKRISATTEILYDENKFIFELTDTGVGIDEEHLKKAFSEKFTTKETGHGFGLLVCKRIIESHEGKLDVSSQPGQGTTIHIEFPLYAEKAVPV